MHEYITSGAARPRLQVLRRLCARMEIDERLYFSARRVFEAASPKPGTADAAALSARLGELKAEGAELAERAARQQATPVAALEAAAGARLDKWCDAHLAPALFITLTARPRMATTFLIWQVHALRPPS